MQLFVPCLLGDLGRMVIFRSGIIFAKHCSSMKWSITGKFGLEAIDSDHQEPHTVYGLALACSELGEHFKWVLEAAAPESLRGLARNGLREISVGQENIYHNRSQFLSEWEYRVRKISW